MSCERGKATESSKLLPSDSLDKPMEAPVQQHSAAAKTGAVLYYMLSSILTQSATKAVLSVYGFNYPAVLCFSQMLFTAPICWFLVQNPFSTKLFWSLLPIGLVNGANICAGLAGTGGLTVPMFIVLRRFTMVLTMLMERIWFGQKHHWQVVGSVSIMIIGAIVAAATDLSFSLYGYTSVLVADLLTASYLVMLKHLPAAKEVNTATLLYYNALIGLIPMAAFVFVTGEYIKLHNFELYGLVGFQLSLVAAVCMGLSISHSTQLCTRMNEPLTTSVAGSFKNIAMTFIGIFAFGDFVFEYRNVFGIVLSMLGALWYAFYSAMKKSGGA